MLKGYQSYLQSTSKSLTLADIKTKALSASMKVFSTLGWMALFTGISWAIGKAVEDIDHLINHEKYAQKALESALETSKKFKDSISNTREELNKTKKSVSEIASEYAKLSQGVDIYTNENISLTNEQYEEFISLNNQLAELFPSLTRNYDENGNAILGLGGSVESVTDKIRTLIEQQERLATIEMRKSLEGYVNGDEDGNGGQIEVLKGLEDNLEKAENELIKFKEKYDAILNGKQVDEDFLNGKQLEEAKDYYKNAFGLTEEELKKSTVIEKNFLGEGVYRLDFENLEIDESRKEEILEFYNSFYKELNDDILYAQSELDTANKEMSNMMMMWVEDESLYKDGGNTFQTLIQSMIEGIDWNQLGIENYDDAKTWIKDNIFHPISSVDGDDKNILTDAIDNLLSLDLNNLPIDKVKEKIDKYLATIAEILGQESADKLKVNLGFDYVDTLVNNVKGKLQDSFDDKVSELSLEDLEIAANKLEIDPSVPLSWDELIAKIEEYKASLKEGNESPILSITDTFTQLNTQLKPAFDSLRSAYQDIFTIEDGKKIFSIENLDLSAVLSDLQEKFNDVPGFDTFLSTVTDPSSTSDDVQTSINTLATEIVNSLNPALKDATGESYQLVQQMLESLGVQNAEQVMLSSLGYTYEEYTAAKQECANAGFDLANATEEEIANFIAEQGGAENCGEALALLQLKKLLLNTTRIDQTSDINNILTLAGTAGVASESMVRLANAKLLLDNAVANNDARGIAVAKQELIDAGQAAKDSVLDFKPVELDFSPDPSSKSKGSGSKSEKDTHLETYKKELAELEHLHNMELITDKEFYDRLRDLNEKYFNDSAEHHEKYLDEYQSNEEKIFKGLKQVYQDSLEEHKSMMDSAASHAQRVLDKEIDKLKSDSKTTIKHYEQRIDAIDKEIDAKQGLIDKHQDELDAMELANQKRKDAIALQKAQYELDRAQNQRTIGQYQNGQKIYLTDGKAVRDAEDTRDEAKYNIKRTEIQEKISLVQKEIDALEAKQDRLQAKIDQENQALDAQIEKLEAYKERWAEIAEKQTIAQEEAAFLAICGAEGEAEILAMREGILQGFSDNYDAITTNLADLAQANADRMAEIASQMESAASRAAKAASDMAKAQASMSSSKGEKYASGTKSAKRGLNLVAEEKPEAIIDNEGVRLITNPTLLQMSGGEQVLNGEETETLLDGDTSLSPRIKELLSRSQIESIGNFANMNVMPSFQHNVKLPSFDFSKLQVREVTPTSVVQEINMTLPNVTNESGAQYIINTLNRLPLDTLQYSNRR